MTFDKWREANYDTEWSERDYAQAAWSAAAVVERERLARLAETNEDSAGFHSLSAAEIRAGRVGWLADEDVN